jgi:hypothetical protein
VSLQPELRNPVLSRFTDVSETADSTRYIKDQVIPLFDLTSKCSLLLRQAELLETLKPVNFPVLEPLD